MTPAPSTPDELRAAWLAAERAKTDALTRAEQLQRSCNRYVSALTQIRDGAVGWRAIAAQALDPDGLEVVGGVA